MQVTRGFRLRAEDNLSTVSAYFTDYYSLGTDDFFLIEIQSKADGESKTIYLLGRNG